MPCLQVSIGRGVPTRDCITAGFEDLTGTSRYRP